MTLRWQTLGIAQEFRLFREKQIVGILKSNLFDRKGYAELHGFLMRFESEGIGKGKTRILDIEGENVLGTIDFSFFSRSAVIHHEGHSYEWSHPARQKRKHWLVKGNEEEAEYRATGFVSSQGTITTTFLHPIVLMAGLYTKGYFIKISFLIIIMAFLLGIMAAVLVSLI